MSNLTTTCKITRPLLSEFVDDQLDAAAAWQVQTHLAECADCGQISRDLEALRLRLQALPVRGPSAQFEAALAQRLAMTRQPAPPTRRALLAQGSRVHAVSHWFRWPLLRPALALGFAAVAGASVVFVAMPPAATVPPPVAVHHADHAFVADCLAQRRRDAVGEPLADISAQNLVGGLDSSSTANAAEEPTADAGVF